MEMQRHRFEHALPVVADRRHEDRPPGQVRVKLRLGQMLVLEAQTVKLEGRRAAVLETRDHGFAAAGIAAHRIDGDGIIRGHQAGIDQRPQQRDRAGRIAAGVRDLPRRLDFFGLIGRQFRKPVSPVRRDAKRGRGVQHLRRRGAHAVDQLDRLLGGVIRQAQDHEIDVRHQRLLRLRILALVVGNRCHRHVVLRAEPLGNAEAGGAGAAVDEYDGLLRGSGGFGLRCLVSDMLIARSFRRKSLNRD